MREIHLKTFAWAFLSGVIFTSTCLVTVWALGDHAKTMRIADLEQRAENYDPEWVVRIITECAKLWPEKPLRAQKVGFLNRVLCNERD
jgi:hypothetical protein